MSERHSISQWHHRLCSIRKHSLNHDIIESGMCFCILIPRSIDTVLHFGAAVELSVNAVMSDAATEHTRMIHEQTKHTAVYPTTQRSPPHQNPVLYTLFIYSTVSRLRVVLIHKNPCLDKIIYRLLAHWFYLRLITSSLLVITWKWPMALLPSVFNTLKTDQTIK